MTASLLWLAVFSSMYPPLAHANDGYIDIQNSNAISEWWYQCLIYDTGTSTISNVEIKSNEANSEYNDCTQESWQPYPWTCVRLSAGPYVAPLTVRLTNDLGQLLVFDNLITTFTSLYRWNTTQSFSNIPSFDVTTTSPTAYPSRPPISTDPAVSPATFSPSPSPTTANITDATTTTHEPEDLFLTSTLQSPLYVGYINSVHCNTSDDIACLSSLGLPGWTRRVRAHQYNVLNFGSYVMADSTPMHAVQFWFHPRQYLRSDTVAAITGKYGASDSEIRLALHNIYATYNIKIFLSTLGDEDDDELSDSWLALDSTNLNSVASTLASIVREYWFDGININFDALSLSGYFDFASTAEQALIVLTQSLNAQLNRGSINPYYIITHTAPSIYFQQQSTEYPNGAYLMVHQFCSDIIQWYNIKFYNYGSISYDTFDTLFTSHNTSIDALIFGENTPKISILGSKMVIARSADSENLNGYLPASIFADILSSALSRRWPYWSTGFMVYDFLTDEADEFNYSLTLIQSFQPTPSPTMPTESTTVATYPTVVRYTATTDQFDLLNLNSYGWGEWFFLCTMLLVMAAICVGIGCCYHRYRVKDRILTDEQIKDLEDNANKTMVSDSLRRLSKLLKRTPTMELIDDVEPTEMDVEQAQRVLGQSICKTGDEVPKVQLMNIKSVDGEAIPDEAQLAELIGRSVDYTNDPVSINAHGAEVTVTND